MADTDRLPCGCPAQPWATVAAVGEVAALRRQRDELLALGVSMHKNTAAGIAYYRGRVVDYLSRRAADAHEAGRDDVAVALAGAADWIERTTL